MTSRLPLDNRPRLWYTDSNVRILWTKRRAPKQRDYQMVALIKGAVKGGPHVDRKKAANKKAARKRVRQGDES